MTQAEILLRELVLALNSSYISSWQSTAGWQYELDKAQEYIKSL